MTVVLEYINGKTEIVSFDHDGGYPHTVKIRRFLSKDARGNVQYARSTFRHVRSLPGGKPVYAEQRTGPEAA
jgi:hypothetical protein